MKQKYYIVEQETSSMKNEDGMWSMIVPWPKETPIANMTSGEPMPAKEVGNYKVGHQRK